MSGTFRERLRRLRREDAAAGAGTDADSDADVGPVPRTEGLPASLRRRLDRERSSQAEQVTPHARSAGDPLDLVEQALEAGAITCARTRSLDAQARHGNWRLLEVDGCDPEALIVTTGEPRFEGFDPRSALYLDTETSGLSGGAGTYVFLVGLGRFEGDRFVLWQGFLRDPAGERALLEEVARRVRAAPAVVSFFGKSFDRHRLEDKMRLHSIEPPFEGRLHLDLYHPLRRLYRRCLPDGRLKTMESRLCGLERDDDLPGSQAPEAWFDYLAGRRHRLEGVFAHNSDDVLSLVTLTAHLGRALVARRLDSSALEGCARTRAEALARSFEVLGRRQEAQLWFRRALEGDSEEGELDTRTLRLAYGTSLRKSRRTEEARSELERVVAGGRDPLALCALQQLALLYERSLADRERSRETCRMALELLGRVGEERVPERVVRDLKARQRRLGD